MKINWNILENEVLGYGLKMAAVSDDPYKIGAFGGSIYLYLNDKNIGSFYYEDEGVSKSGIQLFSTHSDLDEEYHGRGWGLLGYLLLAEEVSKIFPDAYVAPNSHFGRYKHTSRKAKAVWKVLKAAKCLKKSAVKTLRARTRKIVVYRYIGRPLAGHIIEKIGPRYKKSKNGEIVLCL